MDYTPTSGFLKSKRNENIDWVEAAAELIDNALDAGALRIELQYGPGKEFSIVDDGVGCQDLQVMVRLGGHKKHDSTRLGRYGVGLKDAALWLWGIMEIDTTHKEQRSVLKVNWDAFDQSGSWQGPDPILMRVNGKRGTAIHFHKIERPVPRDANRYIERLSYLFTPALAKGKQIKFVFGKKETLATAYRMPSLIESFDREIKVQGRGVRVIAGVTAEGEANSKPGFTYCHHHRVIMGPSPMGCGEFSIRRFCGQVWLDDSWKLTSHKDDISDLKDELEDAVYECSKTLLEKAHHSAMTVAHEALNDKLNAALNAAIKSAKESAQKDRKEKRSSPENNTGVILPVDSGIRRNRASKLQDGGLIGTSKSIPSFQIHWLPMDEDTIGIVDINGRLKRVTLNDSHPYLVNMKHEENISGLLAIAVGLLCHDVRGDGKNVFCFMDKNIPFASYWSKALKGAAIVS